MAEGEQLMMTGLIKHIDDLEAELRSLGGVTNEYLRLVIRRLEESRELLELWATGEKIPERLK